MRDYNPGPIGVLKRNVCQAPQGIRGDMERAGYDKLAILANLVVVVAVRHITGVLIDCHNAQAVRATTRMWAMVWIEREVPELNRFSVVLH